MAASGVGNRQVVKILLAAKADVNAKANEGLTALLIAAEKGHQQVVKELLAAWADMNAKMSNGSTALLMASQSGHLLVVQMCSPPARSECHD
jgi:ankyrin repeat protein